MPALNAGCAERRCSAQLRPSGRYISTSLAERLLDPPEQRLKHPHILSLIDSGEAAGQFFYVMPYVESESLRQRLEREGQLPVSDVLRLTTEVAEALDYAHQEGIIHRDIKPENLLLTRGHALVADFGIALAVSIAGRERLTETGLSLGTPAYMSPEQATATPMLDGRSDQYSLACVVYEMLAGEPPYTGPSAQAIIAKRFSEPVPHLSTVRAVPAAVEVAVTRALSKAAAGRGRGPESPPRHGRASTARPTVGRRDPTWPWTHPYPRTPPDRTWEPPPVRDLVLAQPCGMRGRDPGQLYGLATRDG